jgi:opacity protein-like surface antigen
MAPADEDEVHLYLSGNLGGSFAKGRSSRSLAGTPNIGSDQDEDVFGGGALGVHYDRGNIGLRVELEGQAARGYKFETKTGPGGSVTLYSTAKTWTMFSNVWLDFPITDCFSFFGGGGVGFQVTDLESHVPGLVREKSHDDTTFAWQTGGGVTVSATDWLSFDVGYRFIDLGEPDLKFRFAPSGSKLKMHMQSHDLVLGIRANYFSF